MASESFLLTEAGCQQWVRRTFRELGKDERHLEQILTANPQLLGMEDRRNYIRGPYVPFNQVRVDTPQGREVFPDIVFLTESGHIIVVEVKLADNPELRDRRVVAQVLDYAASLAAYEESDLVELFGGDGETRFEDLIRRMFPGTSQSPELAQVLFERMRSAEIHLVIACDGAPDGLREFVRGVTNQSALGGFELRVVELVPHVADGHPGVLLLPHVPVRTEIVARTAVSVTFAEGTSRPSVAVSVTPQAEIAEAVLRAQAGSVRKMRPALAAAVEEYDRLAEPYLRTMGRAPTYRQIKPTHWAGNVHYEFLAFDVNGVGVELHLEADSVKYLVASLEPLAQRLKPSFPDIVWDPKWSKGRGRLMIRSTNVAPVVIAKMMHDFISYTRPVVEEAMAEYTAAPT
jgi:hypothetical protein